MLESLFGNPLIEKILFYLLVNKKCYATSLKDIFQNKLFSIQRMLSRLEQGGILISYSEGKTRIYEFNPRYVFLPELLIFLRKTYQFLPEDLKLKYYEPVTRKRPRRSGKPI